MSRLSLAATRCECLQNSVRGPPGPLCVVRDTPNCPNSERLASSAPAPCLILCGFFFALATPNCAWAPRHTEGLLPLSLLPQLPPRKHSLPVLFSSQTLRRSGKFCACCLLARRPRPRHARPPRRCLQVPHCTVACLFVWPDRELQEQHDDSSVGRKLSAAGILEQVFNKQPPEKTRLMESREQVPGSPFCS